MFRHLYILLVVSSLAACSGGSSDIGSFNPFGSFGSIGSGGSGGSLGSGGSSGSGPFSGAGTGSDEAAVADPDQVPGTENLVAIEVISQARSEDALRGLMVLATGVAPTQGYSRAELVPQNRGIPDENGVLAFRFMVQPPQDLEPAGAQRTREFTAAVFIPDADLEGISGFRIVSRTNAIALER